MRSLDQVGLVALDALDVRIARDAPGLLRPFNEAGVILTPDVQVARRIAAFARETGEEVLLAAALAVRAPRLGHVCTDVATVASSSASELDTPIEPGDLPWPDPSRWLGLLAVSPLVVVGDDNPDARPLRLVGTRLYLDRYWREECAVAADLRDRSRREVGPANPAEVVATLARLFPQAERSDAPDLQMLATAAAVQRRFVVIAGGPGTGKTTTVARLLALLDELAPQGQGHRIALAAPTGKAAARLEESLHSEAKRLDISGTTRARLLDIQASTLHRLLGWRPDSNSRFKHDRGNPVPYDVVVVDEMSMVSLTLMARLVEAVRHDARLVLLGDPDQLASVEAGAILGDIVGPAVDGLCMSPRARERLRELTGESVPPGPDPGVQHSLASASFGDGIVVLRRVHRFGASIAALAEAVQRGDSAAAVDVLRAGHADVRWIDRDAAGPDGYAVLEPVRTKLVETARSVTEASLAGDGRGALDALQSMRLLCAHRRGPYGVASWMAQVERWLRSAIEGYGGVGRWYPGQPLLVTANDYGLRLYNGDTGVVVDAGGGRLRVAFERRGEIVEVSPTRLEAVETVHAMTIHKSQGSQFATVAIVLPDETSVILTRELLYTAVTRAQEALIVVGTEASVRAAVEHRIARPSGLRHRLWG